MTSQQREIRLLNKIISTQDQMIKDNQKIVIPIYVERILKLENDLKHTRELLAMMDKEMMEISNAK